jgi:hypothetical protein
VEKRKEQVWKLWRRENLALPELNKGQPAHSPSLYQMSYPSSYISN